MSGLSWAKMAKAESRSHRHLVREASSGTVRQPRQDQAPGGEAEAEALLEGGREGDGREERGGGAGRGGERPSGRGGSGHRAPSPASAGRFHHHPHPITHTPPWTWIF